MRKRVLILGGTTEASALARVLAQRSDLDVVLSLAGRTETPARPPIPHRIGGFGGVDGLIDYLKSQSISGVIDATHPFAAQMTQHAAQACAVLDVPRSSSRAPLGHPLRAINGSAFVMSMRRFMRWVRNRSVCFSPSVGCRSQRFGARTVILISCAALTNRTRSKCRAM